MLFFYKVKGGSMLPALTGGDFVIATRFYRHIKLNDLLVINHPSYGRIIKRVAKISNKKNIYVTGDNSESISSEQIGSIAKSQIQGKVLFSIKQ